MATTQAQIFVPTAVEKMRTIKNRLIALQSEAAALKGEFTSLGGSAMSGYTRDAVLYPDPANDPSVALWANYPFVATDFTAAMNDLSTAHNAIALSTIYSVGGYNTATKIAIG
jgi:hypothetical protein